MSKKKTAIVKHAAGSFLGRNLTEFAKQAKRHGDGLVKAALERFKKDEQERMVVKVNEVVKHIRALYAQRDTIDKEILLFEGRLQQVHDGQITVDSAGTMHWKDGFYI